MFWWILTGLVVAALFALWVAVRRWSDLDRRADQAAHDPERAQALRDARRDAERGHRGWSG